MIREHRAERVVENLHNIPDRGTLDEYDRPSEGLGPKKLRDSILSDPELHHLQARPAYVPNTVGQGGQMRSLHNDVKLTRENLAGEVVQSANIVDVAKGKVDMSGGARWGAREISVPGLTDNPDSDAGRAVDAKSFADRNRDVNDAIASRATNAEVKNALDVAQSKTTVGQVDARIRKLVKKNSLNRG